MHGGFRVYGSHTISHAFDTPARGRPEYGVTDLRHTYTHAHTHSRYDKDRVYYSISQRVLLTGAGSPDAPSVWEKSEEEEKRFRTGVQYTVRTLDKLDLKLNGTEFIIEAS